MKMSKRQKLFIILDSKGEVERAKKLSESKEQILNKEIRENQVDTKYFILIRSK